MVSRSPRRSGLGSSGNANPLLALHNEVTWREQKSGQPPWQAVATVGTSATRAYQETRRTLFSFFQHEGPRRCVIAQHKRATFFDTQNFRRRSAVAAERAVPRLP